MLFASALIKRPVVPNHLTYIRPRAVVEFCLIRRSRVIPQLAVAKFQTDLGTTS